MLLRLLLTGHCLICLMIVFFFSVDIDGVRTGFALGLEGSALSCGVILCRLFSMYYVTVCVVSLAMSSSSW